MSGQEEIDELVFKALADGRRRRLLDLLKDQPLTTGDLCDQFPELDRCTVMQHLGVLERAELIIVKREGRVRWNYLNCLPIKRVYDRWLRSHTSQSIHVLERLKADLES